VFISLCVQAVIIYLASAVFAVGWVWIVTARHRETAWRIPRLFLGVVFSKALLFFLLGVAMAIATASTAMTGDGLAKNLGLIVMACAAMLLAAFAPLMLLRHAPVIPGTSTSRDVGESMAGAGAAAGRAVRGGRPAAAMGASKLSALAGQSRTGGSGKAGTVVGNAGRPSSWGGTGSGSAVSGSSGGSASTAAAVSGTAGAGRPGRPNPAATRSSTASSSGPSGKQPRSGRPAGHPGPGRRGTDAGAAPSPVPVGSSAGSRGGTSSSTSRDHAAAGSAVAGGGTGTRRAPDPAPTPGSASGTRSLTEGLRATPAPPAPPAPVSPRPGEAR